MWQHIWHVALLNYFSFGLCKIQIAIVHDNECDFNTFNLLACQGARVMQEKHVDDVIYDQLVPVKECKSTWLKRASSHKIVVFVGFQYEECSVEIAMAAEDSWIVLVDSCPADASFFNNLICATFSEAQPSYVAGYLAGLISTSKVAGVIGGIPVPPVQRSFNGYLLGVRASCSECQIEGMYVNSFFHPSNANDTARYLVKDLQADVVFGCGGGTGSEAIKVAAELGAHVIGVDSDEFETTFSHAALESKRRVITSVLKRTDMAVELIIPMLRLPSVGQRVLGLVGNSLILDYTNGGVGTADCHLACGDIGLEKWNAMRRLEKQLSANVLSVPLVGFGWSVPLTPARPEKNTFYPAPAHAKPPDPRIHSAIASFNAWLVDFVVIFGGQDLGRTFNDLWLYNIQSAKWLNGVHGITDGLQPPALAKACAVSLGSQSVFIFGGRTDSGSQSSDVYSYTYQDSFLGFGDPTSSSIRNTWMKLTSQGDVPVAVEGPSCAQLSPSCGIVFGGRAFLEDMNTVHMFCIRGDGVHWELLSRTGGEQSGVSAPQARERAGVAIIDASTIDASWPSGNSLIVAGGVSKGAWMSDVWLLSLDSSAGWMRLPDLPWIHRSAPLVTMSRLADRPDSARRKAGPGLRDGESNVMAVLVVQPTSAPMDTFTYDPNKGQWNTQMTGFSNSFGDFFAVEQTIMTFTRGGEGISPHLWFFGGTVNGTYQNILAVSSFAVQIECLPGEKAQGVGCEACGPGMSSAGGIGASCVLCSPGRHSSANMSASCSDCPAGRYGSRVGQHFCPLCLPGRYKGVGDSPCEPCPTGTYGAIEGATVPTDCVPCAAGRYTQGMQGLSNQSDCIECPAGSALQMPVGEAACKLCPSGMFSQSGQAVCSRCPLGQYQSEANQSMCLSCDVVLLGSTTEFMAASSETDCVCAAGSYRPTGTASGLQCKECPEGMLCKVGSDMRFYEAAKSQGFKASLNSLSFPMLRGRYWAHVDDPLHVFACENEHYCPGGPPGTCASNAEGIACAHCAREYYPTGTSCSKCTAIEMTNIIFPLMPLVLSFFAIWFMYYRFQDKPPRWSSWKNGIAALLYILLNFYQTISMATSANVDFPNMVDQTFSVWAVSQDLISLFKMSCTGVTGFQGRMLAQSLVPIFLALVCLTNFVLSRVLSRTLEGWRPMEMDRLLNVYLSLINAFFLGIVSLSCALFKCQSNPNEESTLVSDLSIVCYTSEIWQSMIAVAVVSILLYCVGSICLFSWAIAVAPRKFHDETFQKRWKFLFIKFRMDVHWWGLIILLKGVVLNVGIVFLKTSAGQLYWMMLTVMAYLIFMATHMPWRHWAANTMDMITHLCAVCNISLIVWFADDASPDLDHGIASTIVVASSLPFLFLVMLALNVCISDQQRRLAHQDHRIVEFIDTFDRVMHCLAAKSTDEKKYFFNALANWDENLLKAATMALRAEMFGYGKSRLVAGDAHRCFTHHDMCFLQGGPGKCSAWCQTDDRFEQDTDPVPEQSFMSAKAVGGPVFSVQEEIAMAELQWTPREKIMKSPRSIFIASERLQRAMKSATKSGRRPVQTP